MSQNHTNYRLSMLSFVKKAAEDVKIIGKQPDKFIPAGFISWILLVSLPQS